MSWRTSPWAIAARTLGRRLGANRLIGRFSAGSGYEIGYDAGLSAMILPGHCVWDVGANVGYYTRLFAERVGNRGRVFAFEPSPVNYMHLCDACGTIPQVKLLQIGLGRQDEKRMLRQGLDGLGATSRISSAGGTSVEIRSGESLLASGDAKRPNVIKIDVEGFELEVIEGLGDQLRDETLRAIGVEVHFGILSERGLAAGPREIESLLRCSGFTTIWADSSHILGTRSG